ncbi:hypothetical protein [Paenibacillus sp. L3-i20]|uniref:hypothetical protein n=1 Tax=Paenibacillus sp. L3-i20 TaxID=2905833 RepID=UPI001EDCA8AA|nr:hypothetical protein [Paenibacillus sp. L3-i20]GKU80159.1 hypothetical protein L3i20_v245560 [Paenibacillus sp. L3-i20]
MAKQETWRDLLLMAGYEAPKNWSWHKCRKVMRLVGTDEIQEYLPELNVKEWAIR